MTRKTKTALEKMVAVYENRLQVVREDANRLEKRLELETTNLGLAREETRRTLAKVAERDAEIAGLRTRLSIAQEERDQAERELESVKANLVRWGQRATDAEIQAADYRRRYRAALQILLELVPE